MAINPVTLDEQGFHVSVTPKVVGLSAKEESMYLQTANYSELYELRQSIGLSKIEKLRIRLEADNFLQLDVMLQKYLIVVTLFPNVPIAFVVTNIAKEHVEPITDFYKRLEIFAHVMRDAGQKITERQVYFEVPYKVTPAGDDAYDFLAAIKPRFMQDTTNQQNVSVPMYIYDSNTLPGETKPDFAPIKDAWLAHTANPDARHFAFFVVLAEKEQLYAVKPSTQVAQGTHSLLVAGDKAITNFPTEMTFKLLQRLYTK